MKNGNHARLLVIFLLALTFPCVSHGFTQYLGGPSHSGIASGVLTLPVVPRWDAELGEKVVSSPVTDGVRVMIGTDQNSVLALNQFTGNIDWKVILSGKVTATPAIADGKVYIGDTNRSFYALNKDTGTQVWKRILAGAISSSAMVKDGKIYVGVGFPAHQVVCLDGTNGNTLWTYSDMEQMCYSSPAAVGSYLLVGADDGALYCLNRTDGTLAWKFISTGGVYMSSPCVDAAGSRIFFVPGDYDANLYCLSLSGTLNWTRKLLTPTFNGRMVVSSPTTAGSYLYLQAAEVIPNRAHPTAVHGFNISPSVFCINIADGTVNWEVQPWPDYVFDNGFLGPITISGENLVVPGVDGNCRILRSSNGEVLGSVRTNKAILGAPLISQNNLFLASTDGNLYVFSGQDSTGPSGEILSPPSGSTVATSVIDFRARMYDNQSGINSAKINLLFGGESYPLIYDQVSLLASTTVEAPFVYGTIVATLSFYNNSGGRTEIPWSVQVRDPSPLSLVKAEGSDEKTIRLIFNSPLASSTALVVSRYSVFRANGSQIAVAGAAFETTTGNDPFRILLLSLTDKMPPGETLTAEVRNLTTIDGRSLAQAAVPFAGFTPNTLTFARSVARRKILLKFNEALADTALQLPQKFTVKKMGSGETIPVVSLEFSNSGPFTGSSSVLINTGVDLDGTKAYQVFGNGIQNQDGTLVSFVSPDFLGFVSPTLLAARSVAFQGVLLTFSDALFSPKAISLPAYQVKRVADGSMQSITQAVTTDPGVGDPLAGVLLTLGAELASETYILNASGLVALDGRILENQTLVFSGDRTIRIVSANAVAPDALIVRFDTPLQYASITDLSAYTILGQDPNSAPVLSSVAFGDAWGFNPDRSIRLNFTAPLNSARYSIGVSQIRDYSGKLVTNLSSVALGFVPLRIVGAVSSGNRQAIISFNLRLATDSAQSVSQYSLINLANNLPLPIKSATLLPGNVYSSSAVLLETVSDFSASDYRISIQNVRTDGDQIVSGLSEAFPGNSALKIVSAKALTSRTLQIQVDSSLTLSAQEVSRWRLWKITSGQEVPVTAIAGNGSGLLFTITTKSDIGSEPYRIVGSSLLTTSGKEIAQVSSTFPGYRPALLLWADVIDNHTVRLRFNAPVEPLSLKSPAMFRLVTLSPPKVFGVVGAKPDPETPFGVLVSVFEEIPQLEMEASVSGITNLEGAVTSLTNAVIPARTRQNYFLTIEPVDLGSRERFRVEVSSAIALPSPAPSAELTISGTLSSVALERTSNAAFQYYGEFSVKEGFSGLVSARVEVRPGLFQSVTLSVQPKSLISSDGVVSSTFQDSILPAGYSVFFLPLSDRLIRDFFSTLGLSSLAAGLRGRLTAQGIVPSVLALEKILAANHAAGPWILFTNDLASSTELFSPVPFSFDVASFSQPQKVGLFRLQRSGEWEFFAGPGGGTRINVNLSQAGVYSLISDPDAPILLSAAPTGSEDVVPVLGSDRRLTARIAEPKNSSGLSLISLKFFLDNEEYAPTSVTTDTAALATQTVWKVEYRHPTPFANRTFSWKVAAEDRLGNRLSDSGRSFNVISEASVIEAAIFPNPVRAGQSARITIRSTVRPEHLQIIVHDTSGDRVATLVDEYTSISQIRGGAWETNYTWDLRNQNDKSVANGVYFVSMRITTGGRTVKKTAKLAILR